MQISAEVAKLFLVIRRSQVLHAHGCIPLTMLVDVCQCCRLLMFVCLPLLKTILLMLNSVNKEYQPVSKILRHLWRTNHKVWRQSQILWIPKQQNTFKVWLDMSCQSNVAPNLCWMMEFELNHRAFHQSTQHNMVVRSKACGEQN